LAKIFDLASGGPWRQPPGGGGLSRRTRGFLDHALEHSEVVDEALPPAPRHAARGQGPLAVERLGDLDQASLFQDLQMAAEIPVGERAELLQVREGETFGMRHQRGENAEARLLVDDAVEARVGEWRIIVSPGHARLPPCGGARPS